MVLHQQGAGIIHAHAGKRGHLGGGGHLRTTDIEDDRRACRHLRTGGRVGADDRTGSHRGIHSLRDQHRNAQCLELLFGIGLHIVGQVRHGDILGAKTNGQSHALSLADGAAGYRRLLIDITGGVVAVVLFFPLWGDLAGCNLIRSHGLLFGHTDIIPKGDIGLAVHQVGGVVQDHPAQCHAGQCKGNGDAEQGRQKDSAAFFARFSLAFFAGCGLFVLTDRAVLVHGTFHHLFGRFFCNILIFKQHGGVLHIGVQCFQHRPCRGVAVLGELCHSLFGDLHQRIGHFRCQFVQRAGLVRDLLDGNLNHVIGIKGQMSGKHLVHHDANRVDVTGAVGLVPFCLLRADIMHAAHCLAGQHLVICPGNAGDTEVHHAQLAVIQQHNILGLDIPVHDAVGVGMLQRLEDLGDEVHGLPAGKFAAPLVEILPQGHAVHIFHNDILQIVVDRDIVHLNDIGVIQQ